MVSLNGEILNYVVFQVEVVDLKVPIIVSCQDVLCYVVLHSVVQTIDVILLFSFFIAFLLRDVLVCSSYVSSRFCM